MREDRASRVICRAAAILLAVAAAVPAASADGDWRRDAGWDDGNAEFCAYELDWRRYGQLYPGRALTVLVKEPWAPDLELKADRPRPDGFEVLKLNFVRDVPTGIYTYHQMASVFLRRDDGALRKLATSSTEGCGISTSEMTGGTLETRSYFDGQGERRTPWPEGALPEDGLPAVLRDWVRGEVPASLRVFPSLLAGRYPPLEADEWRLTRSESSGVELPAGTFAGVELRLDRGDDWMAYLFAAESPHRLLRLTRSDGSDYRLAKCERIPYWQMTRPGGELWLPDTVRSP
jgi:hypothetical protein